MHLLSKINEKNQIGATKNHIINTLNIKNRNNEIYFQNLIKNLSNYIEPLGLQVRYNPLDSHWYITYEKEITDILSANPFDGKPRLAATLLTCIICCLQNSGVAKIQDIRNLRDKKGILKDLKDLEQMNYITIIMDENKVKLTSLIGYQLDLQQLFVNLALKMKENEKNKN